MCPGTVIEIEMKPPPDIFTVENVEGFAHI